jgi:hypothetical protein
MFTQENLIIQRSDPSGNGGDQFLYEVNGYGILAINPPMEEISQLHWEVEVIKYTNIDQFKYEVCHTTELADKTLVFYNDKSFNEFLLKAFDYFKELDKLEKML